MKLIKLISVSLLLAAAACSSEGSGTTGSSAPVRPLQASAAVNPAAHAAAAAASIDTLANLVSQGDPTSRGFHSIDEVQQATLSGAVPMSMLGLDGLRGYQAGQDPRALLIDEQSVMYPITVGGDVRSSVIVKQRAGGTWEAASFGHANLAKSVHLGRRGVSALRGVAEADVSLVRVPTLSTSFLGHEESGKLMLTPLADVARTSLKAGQTRAAEEVLAELQPLAAQVNAAVPN